MPLARWQTESNVEPEVVECVAHICIAVSCVAPVSESLGIIHEMEEFQRALWETEAQREAKERRLRLERRQRARLKLEKSRQELEDRVRRRQEARREERGVRVAAPMVVMKRNKPANPNNPGTGFRAHRDAAGTAAAHVQSRLPFTNGINGGVQHGAPPGMRPPSRERNLALAMAHEAGFAPSDVADILPEMTGGHGFVGKGAGRGGWPTNAELSTRLYARLQAAQSDLATAEQLRQQKASELRRGGVFARTVPPEKAAGLMALTPRKAAECSSVPSSGRSVSGTGRGIDESGARRSGTMRGRGLGRSRGRGNGPSRGGRHKKALVRLSPAAIGNEYGLTSTAYTSSGADEAGEQAFGNGSPMLNQRGREAVQMQQSPNRRDKNGQDPRSVVPHDKQRGDLQGAGFRSGSGHEPMHDPAWRLGTGTQSETTVPLEATGSAAAAAIKEAQKREELYRIQYENSRLRHELAEHRGADHIPNSTNGHTASSTLRAEKIAGSPFYQFTIPLREALGPGSDSSEQNSSLSSRGGPGSAATPETQQPASGGLYGDIDRAYDCPDTLRPSSSDSDESDIDGSIGDKAAAASAGSTRLLPAGHVVPSDDVTAVCGTKTEPRAATSSHPQQGATRPKSARPKQRTGEEARASTRGNWNGIRSLLVEHEAIATNGQGLSAAATGEKTEDNTEPDGSNQSNVGGAARWQESRAELDNHSLVQTRLGEIHAMVLDTVRWEKKKERRAEAREERKSSFRSASLDVATRAFERGRPDLLYSSQFR